MSRPRKTKENPLWLKLDYYRKLRGYTRNEFCTLVGISTATWTDRAEPVQGMYMWRLGELLKIANLLHINLSDLLEEVSFK